MFGLFKKKTPLQRLNKKYENLLAEAFSLSKTNRKASDEKHAEAEAVLKEIDNLSKN